MPKHDPNAFATTESVLVTEEEEVKELVLSPEAVVVREKSHLSGVLRWMEADDDLRSVTGATGARIVA